MTKQEIKKQVEDKVNPLIESLKKVQDGPIGEEEYGLAIFYKSDVRKICAAVFEETYELSTDAMGIALEKKINRIAIFRKEWEKMMNKT